MRYVVFIGHRYQEKQLDELDAKLSETCRGRIKIV